MNEVVRTNLPGVSRVEAGIAPEARPSTEGGKNEFLDLLKKPLNSVKTPDVLNPSQSPLKFSSHAMNRVRDREIPLNADLLSKLESAVNTASGKGSKDSLILSKDAAFIVSVKNRTVVTVLDRSQMDGNVFTNIDSTVVI